MPSPSSNEQAPLVLQSMQTVTSVENIKSPSFRSVYANNSALAISTFDFAVIFGEIVGAENGKLIIEQHTKITMSPLHAKVFAKVFNDNVAVYEKQFGEIKIPTNPPMNVEKK